jgi:hypothetical protein
MINAKCDRCGAEDTAKTLGVSALFVRSVVLPDGWCRVAVPRRPDARMGAEQARMDLCGSCVNVVRGVMLAVSQTPKRYVALKPPSPEGWMAHYKHRYRVTYRNHTGESWLGVLCVDCPEWSATRKNTMTTPASDEDWLRGRIEAHEAMEHSDPPVGVDCPECGDAFEPLQLPRHMQEKHPAAQPDPLMCEHCGARYTGPDMTKHMVSAHPLRVENARPVCNLCGGSLLWDHPARLWIHENEENDANGGHVVTPIPEDEWQRGERP